VNPGDVAAATALLDVLPRDRLAVGVVEGREEIRLRVAVVAVGHEVDVVPARGVFDRLLRLFDYEVAALGVPRFFEVGRPRVVVDSVRDGFYVFVEVRVVVAFCVASFVVVAASCSHGRRLAPCDRKTDPEQVRVNGVPGRSSSVQQFH
jgi:hypothetical protein